MLVIISDLHLTDGSTGNTVRESAFEAFRNHIEDLVFAASKREDGTYRPIEEIDIILLGDILDPIRSLEWSDPSNDGTRIRPWYDPGTAAFPSRLTEVTKKILQFNQESLLIMKNLADGNGISIPPATKTGKIDRRVSRDRRSKCRVPVRANIYYMVGNHDWLYHLPGEPYDDLRRRINSFLGLANSIKPYPHSPEESKDIMNTLEDHKVYTRHGDIYDPMNYDENFGRAYSSIGDALVVELFNRFPFLVKEQLSQQLPPAFFKEINEMGNIRPLTITPTWVASTMDRHHLNKTQESIINDIWDSLVDNFINLDFLKELNEPFKIDLVDKVKTVLRFSRPLSLKYFGEAAPDLYKIEEFIEAVSGKGRAVLDQCAAREKAYLSNQARFIVYGHTHNYKMIPLRSQNVNGKKFDQIYINSGTWHPLHELGSQDSGEMGFVSYKAMTFLAFYKGDERKGRKFEVWNGILDL